MAESPRRTNPDADSAMALLRSRRHGVLCTAHARHAGWPFGSIVPYAVLPGGDPVVMLSAIAEHTRNLLAEPRCCLFVHEEAPGGDVQSLPRAALLCRAERLEGDAADAAAQVFLDRFPEARASLAPDSLVLALRTEHVRWIAGFGSMGWLDRDAWRTRAGAR